MSETIRIKLHNAQQAHQAITAAFQSIKPALMSGHTFDLTVKPETRSTAQNRLMWRMLTEVSEQVAWYGKTLSPNAWKCIFSASLKKQDVVPGLHGDFVVLGEKTSRMTVREMSDLIELMQAFGVERGVRFTAPEYEAETA